jgi:PDZ domain-containing protein
MSLPAESPEQPVRGRRSTLTNWLVGILLVLCIGAGALELVPSHYYALAPGDAVNVQPMIQVKGYPAPHGRGRLLMTDVSIAQVNHKLEELYWRIQPHVDLEPAQAVAGNLSNQQYLQLNDELMSDSIRRAEVAALTIARGYKLHFKSSGPAVVFIVPNSPAVSKLKTGDVIEAIDGHRTRTADSVSPLVKRHRPGQVVHMLVLRHGRRINIAVRTVGSTNGVPKKTGKVPLVGVYVQDQIALPLKMQIDPGNIGGPSAGLMFTLGLIERLEHRDLTKGCIVAGTGAIDFNGAVGPIGGATQKVVAAENAGARYFLVPQAGGNARDARRAASHITVVPVKTLRQAMDFLRRLKPCR